MENIPVLHIDDRRPQSARSVGRRSGRKPSRKVQSARAHTKDSARTARSLEGEEDEDDDSSLDLDFEEEEPWVRCLEEATSAADGLRRLYEEDKETFYTMSETIYNSLKLRFEHSL